MAEIVRMPKMSDTMTEGVIAEWHKKVGDKIESGELLAEIETDKATMDFESPQDGVLLHVGPDKGEAVEINGLLAIIGKKGEDISQLLEEGAAPAEAEEEDEPAPEPVSASGQPVTQAAGQAHAKKEQAKKSRPDTSGIRAQLVRMPKMSDTMTEGVIAEWHKKVGDQVGAGDLLAEIETDKATMDFESPEEGTLLHIGAEAGTAIEINGVLAIIGAKDADFQALLDAQEANGAEETTEETPDTTTAEASTEKAPADDDAQSTSNGHAPSGQSATNGRLKISPLARRMAEDRGFDLHQIEGTGEGGRIVRRDVESFKPQAKPAETAAPAKEPAREKAAAAPPVAIAPPVGEERYREENVSQMRKTIARRLAESKFSAPHFYLTLEIEMSQAMAAREQINAFAAPHKISFNDMVIKAAAVALRQHPKVNASWRGDKIRYNEHVHVGMAVAVEEGLLVPVIRFADLLSLSQISAQARDFGQRARSKQLQPREWEGNTFTISNLGMFGIDEFTAIINPPEACIMAVGGIKETVIVEKGQMRPGHVMKVTLSCDHRVVDGASGAAFLKTFKELLEAPVRLLY